jgi:hypothetical protein
MSSNEKNEVICKNFLLGGRFGHGCLDWKCPFFHPRLCKYSYLFGFCYTRKCLDRHIQPPFDSQIHGRPRKKSKSKKSRRNRCKFHRLFIQAAILYRRVLQSFIFLTWIRIFFDKRVFSKKLFLKCW